MGYKAILDAEVAAGRPLTATLLAKLRDNPRFIAEGDPDAPKIANAAFTNGTINGADIDVDTLDGVKFANDAVTEAKIASGAIHLSQFALGIDLLTVTLAASAFTQNLTNSTNYKYLLGLGSRLVGNASRSIPPDQRKYWHDFGSGGLALTNSSVLSYVYGSLNSEVIGDSVEVAIYYLASSPPYDLGNGEAGLFTFIRRNAEGKILAVLNCDSPPWSSYADGHHYKRDGKQYVRPFMPIDRAELSNPGKREAILAKIRSGQHFPGEIELTPRAKCRNKNLVPHPFGELGPGEYVQLIDPASPIAHDMARLKKAGAPLGRYLVEGLIEVEPEPLAQKFMPNGVEAVAGYFAEELQEVSP